MGTPHGPGQITAVIRDEFGVHVGGVVPDDFWDQYGPGVVVGVGWDPGLPGPDRHLAGGEFSRPEAEAWDRSPRGRSAGCALVRDGAPPVPPRVRTRRVVVRHGGGADRVYLHKGEAGVTRPIETFEPGYCFSQL